MCTINKESEKVESANIKSIVGGEENWIRYAKNDSLREASLGWKCSADHPGWGGDQGEEWGAHIQHPAAAGGYFCRCDCELQRIIYLAIGNKESWGSVNHVKLKMAKSMFW